MVGDEGRNCLKTSLVTPENRSARSALDLLSKVASAAANCRLTRLPVVESFSLESFDEGRWVLQLDGWRDLRDDLDDLPPQNELRCALDEKHEGQMKRKVKKSPETFTEGTEMVSVQPVEIDHVDKVLPHGRWLAALCH